MKHYTHGFTFPEMLVVLGVLVTILGLTTVNLAGLQRKTNLQTTITSLSSELKQLQIKAMTGDTEGTGIQNSYGIYFQNNSYIIFRGPSYNPGDPNNFEVNLETTIQFSSITFPNSQFVFASGSGELVNFVSGSNTITLQNTTNNEQKTITINKYGVITQIN